MLMYAQIINDETKEVNVGDSTNTAFYEKIGMTLQDVESYDGRYFLAGYAPEEPKESEADKAQDEIYRLEMEHTTQTEQCCCVSIGTASFFPLGNKDDYGVSLLCLCRF